MPAQQRNEVKPNTATCFKYYFMNLGLDDFGQSSTLLVSGQFQPPDIAQRMAGMRFEPLHDSPRVRLSHPQFG
jgi:hypothetical protein